jgi:riboflavin kinase/FMN adenylyltransferase
VGTGFTFGKRRSGNVKLLERLGDFHGFKIREIAPFKLSGKIVSSTLIRSLIKKGKLSTARLFLGRPVSILGKVIKGKGLGRILGYPTANISILNEAAPPSGVYAVKVIFNKIKLPGMAFINSEPQNKRGIRRTVLEVHIFNFNKNIYGKGIETEFYKKIRAKKTFKRLNFLKKQIESDSIIVKKFFLR